MITVKENDEINEELLDQAFDYERKIWPEGSYAYLPEDYLKSLFKESREGFFVACVDGSYAGHFYVISCIQEDIDKCFASDDFMVLKNRGMKKGDNILYLYTAVIKEEYRGSGCMKELGRAFVRYLDRREREGCFVSKVYCEAVSTDGARIVTQGFGMRPLDTDEKGIGHYYSDDGLREYRNRMRDPEE